ncbi:MAG: hypothetical protein ACR2K3_04515 [Nocardioides sp.]
MAADKDEKDQKGSGRTRAGAAAAMVRLRVAQLIWLVCVLAALVLAGAALLIALRANHTNDLVKLIKDTAGNLDLTVFSLKDGVFHFTGHDHSADTKNALVNYGLAAVVWLVVGRIVERVVHP